jgi:hypothetical protein
VVKTANLHATDPRSQQPITFDGYLIFFDVKYDNFDEPPKLGKRPKILEGEGANPLVIFDIKQTNEIAIARPTLKNTIQDQLGRLNLMVFLRRVPGTPPPGENYYARAAWTVPFIDAATDAEKFHPLFGGPKGSFVQLERKQMPTGDGRYFRAGHPEPGAFITRPTVVTTNVYVDYLSSIGAI